ncbi:acyl-CoA thioesterase [Rubritalea tangerina]|uniref:Acyl-CoA thioesterase n=1 Tax=Rubritalea tangerina TaxID=430798 RepID=A0ABW4ZGU6_9BACT
METHRLVLTEDLNQYGFLFGGRLLSWADEAGYIAASKDFPDARFVTIGMGKVAFHQSVKNGAIIRLCVSLRKQGTTSATYQIDVYSAKEPERGVIFSTDITYVNIDEEGQKYAL